MSRKIIALLVFLALAACDLPLSKGPQGAPQAWFDMPLDQSTYPAAPVPLIFHASDPGGIQQVELWVNNQPAGKFNSPDVKASLVTFHQNWTPPGPGKFTLQVRALSNQQVWGGFTQTHILVTGGRTTPPAGVTPAVLPSSTSTPRLPARATSTTAFTPTLRPAVRSTSTPVFTATLRTLPTLTFTPRLPPTPVPTETPLPGGVTIERISTDLVYLGGADCGPLEVTITARAVAPGGIRVVVLFYRFQDGVSSSEFQGLSMTSLGGDLYSVTLNPTSLLGGRIPFEQATLQYQVVIQQDNGDTSLRTPVMADIAVRACGRVAASCSSYTDERSCSANGCLWVSIPGTVPLYECRSR